MLSHIKQMILVVCMCVVLAPSAASALVKSSSFEVSGWIPYWRTATGTADALAHLDVFTEINPFVYTVKKDGTFKDNGGLSEEPWASFITTAKAKKVRIIPTIMWSNGDAIHVTLSNTKARIAMEDRIAALVKENNFDGIDIDFEGKKAETKPYFSLFLKGLAQRLGTKKWLMCTIEARTPVSSRYYGTEIPKDATQYANDFKAINTYCDRVRIMAYDQQSIDLALAAKAASSSLLYAPVADPAWVEKVITLTMKDIKKSKIVIGVPTYGYEYEVTAYANNEYMYDILWTFNPGYALPIAALFGITPQRNTSGEMFFTYMPTSTSPMPSVPLQGSSVAGSAMVAATAAVAYADTNNSHLKFRLMDWPDAQSMQQKIELAKRLGVRGIAIFKIDGGEDPNIWPVLAR